MKTPLKTVRGLGEKHHGTEHHWTMRITALALVFLCIGFVWLVICMLGSDYESAKAMIGNPLISTFLLLAILFSGIHMHYGVQTITEDYLQSQLWRTLAKIGDMFFSTVVCAACVVAVLKVSFGG
ncbi:succinate dehydrogenase, hydrophobic membrane anchor protein [uncultured Cohaesibacter sp.]|uniref:succinate dehydrogenase, hydrophobic membrane anchor protein n=1 Tax=uncultured Cohaesibacter sp. TaxID=1002546 RepID=UPI00292D0569|nr:succinate dehydrogenase, hydrophobic membrane anchor protein [uncultured Cohaesibacter sp.]